MGMAKTVLCKINYTAEKIEFIYGRMKHSVYADSYTTISTENFLPLD